jgi:hypothetical protein
LSDIVSIGANCLVQVDDRFFLLAEIEAIAPGVEIDPTIFIEISEFQFNALRDAGEEVCIIQDTIPVAEPGLDVEFKCIFFINDQVFLVFDVENSTDEAVLVRVNPLDALRFLQQEVGFCPIIQFMD